jgi:hypothetical protein
MSRELEQKQDELEEKVENLPMGEKVNLLHWVMGWNKGEPDFWDGVERWFNARKK